MLGHSWDSGERLQRGAPAGLSRLRFLTTLDFPPFSYLDSANHLTGFNVDLARALCDVLEIADRCQIQAMPWEELRDSLGNGQGEAVIAGVAATETARQTMIFSRPYLRMAARFVANKKTPLAAPQSGGFGKQVIGVAAGSSHEKMLRAFFPKAVTASVANAGGASQAAARGKDIGGISAMRWGCHSGCRAPRPQTAASSAAEAYYSDDIPGKRHAHRVEAGGF